MSVTPIKRQSSTPENVILIGIHHDTWCSFFSATGITGTVVDLVPENERSFADVTKDDVLHFLDTAKGERPNGAIHDFLNVVSLKAPDAKESEMEGVLAWCITTVRHLQGWTDFATP